MDIHTYSKTNAYPRNGFPSQINQILVVVFTGQQSATQLSSASSRSLKLMTLPVTWKCLYTLLVWENFPFNSISGIMNEEWGDLEWRWAMGLVYGVMEILDGENGEIGSDRFIEMKKCIKFD